ncbi:ABC transporter substrate-binding protein [Domibacillus robiginosus]|uniref:ABC transporter substrate-binding protein n=1 Tax=Domibacillus robiginosus TaxID=1071054 RepID=UPI00067E1193|nr:ABC transporter substrate-binding protein [Domibacillus robiginosus]
MEKRSFSAWKAMRSAVAVLSIAALTACSGTASDGTSGEKEAEAGSEELFKMKQITSWFPQVENAGQYYAQMEGFYEEEGIEMTTEPGGPQVSSISIVSSGKAQFGMAQADQVLYAIDEGIPLVAVFANFQKTPQGIMFHKDQPIKTFDDLGKGYEIYSAPGSGYSKYLVSEYDIDDSQLRTYTGDNKVFMANKKAASQMYVTSEPYYLKEQGVETGHLLIADSGYSPYGDVLFTTKEFMEENPEMVQAFVNATKRGWEAFHEEPAKVYDYIKTLDSEKTDEQMKYATGEMEELVFGGDAREQGVGIMTEERWQTLIDQVYELKLIEKKLEPADVYTTEFLEKAE